MKQKKCYLCGKQNFIAIKSGVRDMVDIRVLKCNSCGLVFLSSFDHIKKNFYEESKVHGEFPLDLTTWIKVTEDNDERRYQNLCGIIKGKSLLDFGAGTCNFLRKASSVAKRAIGIEPEKRVRETLSSSVELHKDVSDIKDTKFDVITMFHVIEHLVEPKIILSKLCDLLNDEGIVHIETPNADDILLSSYENKAFMDSTYWSCHTFLYNCLTLSLLAYQSGLKCNYIKGMQRYPLSNHLYWLVKDKKEGHKHWNFLNSDKLNNEYEKQLQILGKCDTIVGSFSKLI